jgi:polar amino acid transport system permease protein
MRRIILPQAIKNVLPPIGNSAILLLKNSSLAAVIAVNELMHTGENLATSTFRNIEIFTLVAIIYWLLHYPMDRIVNLLERRMSNDSSKRH